MKWIKRILIFVIIAVIIIIGIFTFLGYQKYQSALKEMPLSEKIASIEARKNYVKLDDISQIFLNAIVSIEDNRFYEHGSIDIISIGRAIIENIKEQDFVQGGSTITQQLAKNMYFTQDKDFTRKIDELFMAIEIENNYSKDKILELYTNTTYFGEGYYGVRSASKGYFKKEPIDMTLYEATLLAGIPNAPSIYAPTKNLNLAEQRQKYVINSMLENGKISQEDANSILGRK